MKSLYQVHSLAGSNKTHKASLTPTRKISPNAKVTFSVFAPTRTKARDAYVKTQLQRIASGDVFGGRIESKKEWTRRFGATKAAMKKAAAVVASYNIEILESNPHNGEHICRGYVRDINRMIPNLDLKIVKIGEVEYRMRQGEHEINAPKGSIVKVVGLDNVPLAKSYLKRFVPTSATPVSLAGPAPSAAAGAFNPFELMPIFNVPDNDGSGQTIGIIALDGGANPQDAIDYARNVLKVKGTITLKVKKIDGATGTPQPNGADIETVLDMDGCLGAPGATIWVCITVNSDAGFAHGIGALIDLGCDIITISWGSSESNWTQQGRDGLHAEFARAFAAGVTVYAAAGDNDAPDSVEDGQLHCDYPASDPLVISMIGLWLSKDGKTFKLWNGGDSGTGGGVSDVYAAEDWEAKGPQVKSLNDGAIRHWVGGLAGPADPATGLIVSYRKKLEQVGGTSADGPIYAGMTARLNKKVGKRVGFFLPYVIANVANDPKLVVPVIDGDNALTGGKGYTGPQLTVGMLNFGHLADRLAA
jgi:kumamolisin